MAEAVMIFLNTLCLALNIFFGVGVYLCVPENTSKKALVIVITYAGLNIVCVLLNILT